MKHSSVLSTERGGRKYGCREAYSCEQRVYTEFDLATLSPTSATAHQHSIRIVVVVVVVCFHSLKFRLSSQVKAASCAWCSSEKPPSKQVNMHPFTICLIVWVFTAVAEWRGDVTPLMYALVAWSRV